jgi:cell division protein FtsB
MASRAATAPAYRLRPGPRRRSGGRPASRVRWDKLGRVILVLVIFGVLASYVGPLTGLLGAYQDRSSAATELTQLRRENAALRARADSSQGPDPAQAAARRLGMVSPGEHSYFVKGLASH